MPDPDRDLIRRLQRGDRTALEVLYRRHVERVWRYAFARTRDRDAAADIVQDTFVRVAKSAHTFAGRAQVSTWLFAIARSALIDQVRRNRRHAQSCEPGIIRLIPAAATPDPLERDEERIRLREALADLRPAQRDAIVLCELCDMKLTDAAAALGWSESRIKVTLHRARRRLAELLSAESGSQRTQERTSERGTGER